MLGISIRRLRGILAEEQISRAQFAAACGLSRAYVSLILSESMHPGELALMKMSRGIENLGLDRHEGASRAS
jgi:transcriptional regulator with XRE-family HTH domain